MDYHLIPQHTKETIDNYANKGWDPGSFVHAVLANDLSGAFGRADIFNRMAMFEIVSYVHNNVPSCVHGSYEVVDSWLKRWAKDSK